MEIPVGMILNGFDSFILVFVRMTGLFVIAPIFGRRNVPTYLKIGFSFFLALILVNTVNLAKPNYSNTLSGYSVLVFKEFIVGLTIGYVAYIIFAAIYVAGQLIDMQIGFGMVNVLDPISNIQVPVTSNFYFIISMLVFLSYNGHHILITGLFDSYKTVPLGNVVFSNGLMNDILHIFGQMFVIGFKIAAPVVAAILITDIALGVISRTIPQLNVFVVGMPLKILLGLSIIVITLPTFVAFVEVLIRTMSGEMFKFLKDMGPK